MAKLSKRVQALRAKVDRNQAYPVADALRLVKECATAKFDESIDIAVNLNGYTDNQRTGLFRRRSAPIQVNYLGYPGTMGAEYMDYLIADATVIRR